MNVWCLHFAPKLSGVDHNLSSGPPACKELKHFIISSEQLAAFKRHFERPAATVWMKGSPVEDKSSEDDSGSSPSRGLLRQFGDALVRRQASASFIWIMQSKCCASELQSYAKLRAAV